MTMALTTKKNRYKVNMTKGTSTEEGFKAKNYL